MSTGAFAPTTSERMARLHRDLRSLRGELLVDWASRSALASDAGGIVHRLPGAVLRPRSAEEVASAVGACHRHGLRVVARGQGHTTLGQAQVQDGLLIDMRSLNRIHEVGDSFVVVDAGATWRTVLEHTLRRGLTPPVLTGYQGLSVGGTLSVGGISGTSYARGPQIEHVLELDVVTGEGRRLRCSEYENPGLFAAVLGGLGCCGVIVRAKLRLVRAPSRVRWVGLRFASAERFVAALRELVARGLLDGISGTIGKKRDGDAEYWVNALAYCWADSEPDLSCLLANLPGIEAQDTRELGYADYSLQVDRLLEQLGSRGWDGIVHPWFDAFLPDDGFEQFLGRAIGALDPSLDFGPPELGALGQVHVFPLLTRALRRPLLRVPRGELVYLFDILTAAASPQTDPGYVARMLARNWALFKEVRSLGGTRYAIAAIPLDEANWQTELGAGNADFRRQKCLHDPNSILGSTGERRLHGNESVSDPGDTPVLRA